MEPIQINTRQAIALAALINAAIGLVLGLIPLLFGYFNRRLKLGAIGFVTTLVGGAIGGAIVWIPSTIIFTWLVVRKKKSSELSSESFTEDLPPSAGDDTIGD